MAISFTRFSMWLWNGCKESEPVSNGSSRNPLSDWGFGFRELDTIKFPKKISPSSRKINQERQKNNRADGEYMVEGGLAGGVCFSGFESDGPEWSIGWVEPHGPEFQCEEDETGGGFAVLVPCYRPGCKGLVEGRNNELLSAISNLPNGFSTDGKNDMEHWLSSIHNTFDDK